MRTSVENSNNKYDELKGDLYNLAPIRTSQLLDAKNVKVKNWYIDTSAKMIKPNNGCRLVFVDISGHVGETLQIHKDIISHFTIATFIETEPDLNTPYVRAFHLSRNTLASITIEENENTIAIWYYYDVEDNDANPQDILNTIMVTYGIYGRYEPYYAVHGYNEIPTYKNKNYLDFNDSVFKDNVKCWLTSDAGELINSPFGIKDHFFVESTIFRNTNSVRYIWQKAYSQLGKLFARYLIWDNVKNEYSNIYSWKDLTAEQHAIGYTDLLKENEVTSPFDFSKYSDTNLANNGLYMNDFIYHRGYVKTITLKVNGDVNKTARVILVKPIDGVVLRSYEITGIGLLTIDVNEYIGTEFYLGINCENSSYKDFEYGDKQINFATNFSSNAKTARQGDVITFSFPERLDNEYCYSLAQKVTYDSVQSSVYRKEKLVTHNQMLVAGDSITAGHPSYNIGEHWWECLGRTYGFHVTPAARNGSGMSYYKGLNACKIARNTDFSKYNIAIFAFGTNDYGNDIPIGTFNDEYTYSEDSSQTFYSAVKYVIETIKLNNPSCCLVFSLPINRMRNTNGTAGNISTKWAYGASNNAGHTLNDYCEAIVYCCNYYGIPYIDHRNGAFDSYSLNDLLCDGLHPTEDGYKILGMEMSAKIGNIIKPYVEYDGIGGIGTF